MPSHERLILFTSLTIVGLVLSLLLKASQGWFIIPLLTSLVWVGTDGVIRGHPHFRAYPLTQRLTFWVLPTLLTLGAALLLPRLAAGYQLMGGVLATALLLAAVVVLEYLSLEPEGEILRRARFALHLATYLIALGLFSGLYALDLALLSATFWTAAVSFLLTVELLREHNVPMGRAGLYAATIGLVLGETRWALGYWPLAGLKGGVFLLLIFYLATGLIHSHLMTRLSKGTLIEFVLVAGLGFAFLLGLLSWP